MNNLYIYVVEGYYVANTNDLSPEGLILFNVPRPQAPPMSTSSSTSSTVEESEKASHSRAGKRGGSKGKKAGNTWEKMITSPTHDIKTISDAMNVYRHRMKWEESWWMQRWPVTKSSRECRCRWMASRTEKNKQSVHSFTSKGEKEKRFRATTWSPKDVRIKLHCKIMFEQQAEKMSTEVIWKDLENKRYLHMLIFFEIAMCVN